MVEEEIKLVEIFRENTNILPLRRGSKSVITADEFINKLADEKAAAIIAAYKPPPPVIIEVEKKIPTPIEQPIKTEPPKQPKPKSEKVQKVAPTITEVAPVKKEVIKESKPPIVPITPEPKPVVKETPKPVVKETPKPVVEVPKPVVKETPKPVVKETPKPVVKETPKPVVKETPKLVVEAPKPVIPDPIPETKIIIEQPPKVVEPVVPVVVPVVDIPIPIISDDLISLDSNHDQDPNVPASGMMSHRSISSTGSIKSTPSKGSIVSVISRGAIKLAAMPIVENVTNEANDNSNRGNDNDNNSQGGLSINTKDNSYISSAGIDSFHSIDNISVDSEPPSDDDLDDDAPQKTADMESTKQSQSDILQTFLMGAFKIQNATTTNNNPTMLSVSSNAKSAWRKEGTYASGGIARVNHSRQKQHYKLEKYSITIGTSTEDLLIYDTGPPAVISSTDNMINTAAIHDLHPYSRNSSRSNFSLEQRQLDPSLLKNPSLGNLFKIPSVSKLKGEKDSNITNTTISKFKSKMNLPASTLMNENNNKNNKGNEQYHPFYPTSSSSSSSFVPGVQKYLNNNNNNNNTINESSSGNGELQYDSSEINNNNLTNSTNNTNNTSNNLNNNTSNTNNLNNNANISAAEENKELINKLKRAMDPLLQIYDKYHASMPEVWKAKTIKTIIPNVKSDKYDKYKDKQREKEKQREKDREILNRELAKQINRSLLNKDILNRSLLKGNNNTTTDNKNDYTTTGINENGNEVFKNLTNEGLNELKIALSESLNSENSYTQDDIQHILMASELLTNHLDAYENLNLEESFSPSSSSSLFEYNYINIKNQFASNIHILENLQQTAINNLLRLEKCEKLTSELLEMMTDGSVDGNVYQEKLETLFRLV